ncbi:T-complex protein 1 subunit eta [Saguinus oedipus]|uniref:T-complex protein 1 subunit eta n=1 Tax=Saguinus oedipus TaxID=9490 RepID=A0ABQ9VZD6_SAGOE|nr:T-complex protein 1 subunit eta [Saguinus oedipus]
MVVDAVMMLDDLLQFKMIGTKKLQGGALQDSQLLELKAEKDNADISVHTAEDYQAIVDAEWNILYDKLEGIHYSGAHIVLSKLPVGDMATSTFLTGTCSMLSEYLRRI